MIRIDSSDQDILREINAGYDKAEWWLEKSLGGKKGEEKYFDELLRRVEISGNSEAGDVVEYIDKNGNRWRNSFVLIPRKGGVLKAIRSFVYYETLGSCGAFVPYFINEKRNELGVMIFTAHFFQRMCERLEIPYRSSAMIQKFLNMMTQFNLQNGKDGSVVLNLPGSQGRGKSRYTGDDGQVIEIRTFLKNTQLSNKQMRETEELRRRSKIDLLYGFEVDELIKNTPDSKEGRDATYKALVDQCVSKGMDRKVIMSAMREAGHIAFRFYELGYMKDKYESMRKVSEISFYFLYDAVAKCDSKEEKKKPFHESLVKEIETIRIARYTAEKMGISQFSVKDFVAVDGPLSESDAKSLEEFMKAYEEIHKEEHKKFGASFHVSMYE